MKPAIHIHAPKSHFIGQVRRRGARRWETVTGKCKTWNSALSRAVSAMKNNHHRARALMIDDAGYYGPTIVGEAKK